MLPAVDDLGPDGRPKRPNQDALLAQLGGEPLATAGSAVMGGAPMRQVAGAAGGAMKGLFGFGGGGDMRQMAGAIFGKPQAPAIGGGVAMPPSPDKAPKSGFAPETPVDPIPSSIFQSGNRSIGGYLQEAMGSKRGDIVKIADEAGRKKAAEDYIRSLVPEIEARGGRVGDIRNEKIQIDGEWRDLLRDIEGAAEAQYIVPSDDSASGGMGMPSAMTTGVPIDSALTGNPLDQINAAIAQYANQRPNMAALLQQLGS